MGGMQRIPRAHWSVSESEERSRLIVASYADVFGLVTQSFPRDQPRDRPRGKLQLSDSLSCNPQVNDILAMRESRCEELSFYHI